MVTKWVGKPVFTPSVVTMLCSEHNRRIKEQNKAIYHDGIGDAWHRLT